MEKKIIYTDNAPEAIGPYSQAVAAGGLLFVSGQISLDPKTMTFVMGDIRSQTEQVLKNIRAILEAAGLTLDNVVKTTVFLTDMKKFPVVNEVYGSFFKNDPPARACVQVAALPKSASVEIEAIAAFPK